MKSTTAITLLLAGANAVKITKHKPLTLSQTHAKQEENLCYPDMSANKVRREAFCSKPEMQNYESCSAAVNDDGSIICHWGGPVPGDDATMPEEMKDEGDCGSMITGIVMQASTFDSDLDGALNYDEGLTAYMTLDPNANADDFAEDFTRADANGSGTVDYEELWNILNEEVCGGSALPPFGPESEQSCDGQVDMIVGMVGQFDTDGDMALNVDEGFAMYSAFAGDDADYEQFLSDFGPADANGDGLVEQEELRDVLMTEMCGGMEGPGGEAPGNDTAPSCDDMIGDVMEMAAQFDTDGDNALSMDEGYGLYTMFEPEADYEQFEADFNDADTDGNGVVDEGELYEVLYTEMCGKVDDSQEFFDAIQTVVDKYMEAAH